MNDEKLYDVAIIGGGLAGLSLAIQCADKNFNVILFEKEEYPFHKVCGEYISLESRDFIQRMGVDLKKLDLPVIKNLSVSDPKGNEYYFNLTLGGFGISRFLLDNSLYTLAKAKGVVVCTNSKVDFVDFENGGFTIKSAGKEFYSKVAAGCFGKRSNLDVKWKRPFTVQKADALNNYVGIKYHLRYPHERDYIYLHNFYNGYCGISKIEDDKSCLCYLTTAANLRECNNSIDELQKKTLFKNPHLREIFNSAEFLYTQPLAISQVSFSKKAQVENHVLMLGDAAGMISPLCGNGMSMAMHSSKMAFSEITQFLVESKPREKMEEEYAARWRKEFSRRLWTGRTVQRFFGGSSSTSIFLKAVNMFPALSKIIIKSTHGKPF